MSASRILTSRTTNGNNSQYTLSQDVAIVVMNDGSARMIDMNDRCYALPRTSALMLELTLAHGSEAAARSVAAEYGIEVELAAVDLDKFLADLEVRGIVQRNTVDMNIETRTQKTSLTARFFATLMAICLRWLPTRRWRAKTVLNLARLSLRLAGWKQTVAAWNQKHAPSQDAADELGREDIILTIDQSVRSAAASNLFGAECKERALSCWAMARAAGMSAALVIGVELFPLAGHCWCEIGDSVVSDDAKNCARYTPVLRYA